MLNLNEEHIGDVVEAALAMMRNEAQYHHDLRCFEEFALALMDAGSPMLRHVPSLADAYNDTQQPSKRARSMGPQNAATDQSWADWAQQLTDAQASSSSNNAQPVRGPCVHGPAQGSKDAEVKAHKDHFARQQLEEQKAAAYRAIEE